MRKNKFFMLGIITVFVAILSLTFVSSTFARYTSTVSGSDSARVAIWKWSFTQDVQGTQSSLATIDLFKTQVYDLDGSNNVVVGTDDAEIKDGAGQPIIAPGSGGKATFIISNESEVSANYRVNFTAEEKGVALEWSLDNATWKTDIAGLNIADTKLVYETGTATINLYWRWVIEGGENTNQEDTNLGLSPVEPTVTVQVIMTQVD